MIAIRTDIHGTSYKALFMDREAGQDALLKQGFERVLGSKHLRNGNLYAFYNKFLKHWVITGEEALKDD